MPQFGLLIYNPLNLHAQVIGNGIVFITGFISFKSRVRTVARKASNVQQSVLPLLGTGEHEQSECRIQKDGVGWRLQKILPV